MNRPCQCDRFTPGDYRSGDCRLCWLASNDDRYRALWGVSGPVEGRPRASASPLPCSHIGSPVFGPSAPDLIRTWYDCQAGKGVVCPCQCGPGCDRYEPDGPEF